MMRGLKNTDAPILRGLQIYHNFIREPEGIQGRTPSEAAGITVEDQNKWLTIIQNAAHEPKIHNEQSDGAADWWAVSKARVRKTLDRLAYASLILDICIAIITSLSLAGVDAPKGFLWPVNYLLTIVVILSIVMFIVLLLLRATEKRA
jgi:hypothetical protein